MKANILMTCCGRKSYLAEIFRSSPLCGLLAAADSDPRATIRQYVDEFIQSPSLSDEGGYIDALFEVCARHEINAIIPQNDLDLVLLAKHRSRFESAGVRVLGVPLRVAIAMADKLESATWLRDHGIPSPETALFLGNPVDLPVIAKSRFGQGSHGLHICRTADDFRQVAKNCVVQDLLEGEEFNLDILRDDFGTVRAVVVKKKLAMRNGSTDKAVSVRDQGLEALGRELGDALELEGSVDVDVIVTDQGPFVIDVNSRVGGGFPFTAQICPAYVDTLLKIALHRRPDDIEGYAEGIEIHRETRYCKLTDPQRRTRGG